MSLVLFPKKEYRPRETTTESYGDIYTELTDEFSGSKYKR